MYDILKGLTVFELSAFIAAPLGGMTLAQLGADVIRIDPLGGAIDRNRWPKTDEGTSLYWTGLNKVKRSLTIDLRRAEGQALLRRLLTGPGEGRGIVLTNFPLRGFLDYEELKAEREDLILLAITGHHDGKSAVDYTVNCAVGVPSATGPADSGTPVNPMLPAWDIATGHLAAAGILAAERQRRLTGKGQLVTLALSDVAYAAIGAIGHIAEAELLGRDRPPIGNHIYGAFGTDLPTADGRRVMAVAITAKQWRALLGATGKGEEAAALGARLGLDLSQEEARYHAREELKALFSAWSIERNLADVAELFEAHEVCWGPYQTFTQMVREDPRCSLANPLFQEIDQPGVGRCRAPGSPLSFAGKTRGELRPAPLPGADSAAVLSEHLGLRGEEIEALQRDRLVGGSEER